jgi:predicted transcriptional regulator
MDKDFLKHYGILGMHWGRKKGTTPSSSNVTVVRTRNSEDHDKKTALKSKKLNEMSNDELRTYTQRMALEKQYKELSKNDRSIGKKIVDSIIDKAIKGATDTALNAVNKQAAKMVDEVLKKTMKKAI